MIWSVVENKSCSLSPSLPACVSPSSMLSEIRLNKLHASSMAATSLISYTCLITVVRSHFLFHTQPSAAEQASVGLNTDIIHTWSKRGKNGHPCMFILVFKQSYALCECVRDVRGCVRVSLSLRLRRVEGSLPWIPPRSLFQFTLSVSGNRIISLQNKRFIHTLQNVRTISQVLLKVEGNLSHTK